MGPICGKLPYVKTNMYLFKNIVTQQLPTISCLSACLLLQIEYMSVQQVIFTVIPKLKNTMLIGRRAHGSTHTKTAHRTQV